MFTYKGCKNDYEEQTATTTHNKNETLREDKVKETDASLSQENIYDPNCW